jgi:NAD-dependent deacetylase
MKRDRAIVVLTGAGISAESGVSTFRDKDGVWSKVDYRDVATPEAFQRDPGRVHDFYNMRRRGLVGIAPNAAHHALVELEQRHSGAFTLVTQNVDNLHASAGSKNLIHMHGQLTRAFCRYCDAHHDCTSDLQVTTPCPSCRRAGGMRPDIVWFGEMPYHMDEIGARLDDCDLFISIGTSGNVYPAAGFVEHARSAGAHCVELNLEPSEGASRFHATRNGRATAIVPAFVTEVLSG